MVLLGPNRIVGRCPRVRTSKEPIERFSRDEKATADSNAGERPGSSGLVGQRP